MASGPATTGSPGLTHWTADSHCSAETPKPSRSHSCHGRTMAAAATRRLRKFAHAWQNPQSPSYRKTVR